MELKPGTFNCLSKPVGGAFHLDYWSTLSLTEGNALLKA